MTRDAYDYIDYAMGYDKSKRFPLFVKPSEKIGVKDVADAMRDHFEGTPMDMTADIGAGGNRLPYRWRPMSFEVDGKRYVNERAMATQQTGFWLVGQSRGWLPDIVGGVIWFGCDDAATSYLTPIYTNTEAIPESFREGNGNMLKYSPTSAFWMCNRVANACYKAYDIMAPTVREAIDTWENNCLERLAANDAKAMEIYEADAAKPNKYLKKGRKPKVYDKFTETKAFLTDFSVRTADEIFAKWTELEELLLVKFIDGNVKAQNPDGSWVTNGHSDVIPGRISQPGYSELWKKTVARDHGDIIQEK